MLNADDVTDLYVTHLYKTSHMSQKTKTVFLIWAERGEEGL